MFTGSPSQVKIDARPRGTEPTLSHLTSQLDRNRQLVRLPTIPSKIKCSHLRSALESIFAPAIHACFPLEGIRVFRRAAVPPSNFAPTHEIRFSVVAVLLLALMAVLAGGAALRESVTFDEVAHIGAGVSYLQKFDLRLNEEHPPLPKILAAFPLVLRGTHAGYSHLSWTISEKFFPAFFGQWVFGDWLLTKWNEEVTVLAWARLSMLLLTLALGWIVFVYGRQLGGEWAGLLCLTVFVSTPAFLTFGPLVLTDIPVTLYSLITIWRFADLWENPTKWNSFLFGMSFAAALLSKFTAGILIFVFIAFVLSTRWLPLPGQPNAKAEARVWRKLRWRSTRRGIFWAAVAVYLFYFIFSIRQSTNVLYQVGRGPAHNCAWLQQFPMQAIAGGSMYALHLPSQIPPVGSPGGPPDPSDYRYLGGMEYDSRIYFLGVIRDPEKLPQVLAEMQARFQKARDAKKYHASPPKDTR